MRRLRGRWLLAAIAALGISAASLLAWQRLGPVDVADREPRFEALAFSDLPEWTVDRHGRAFAAFRVSCARLDAVARARAAGASASRTSEPNPLLDVCRTALRMPDAPDDRRARAFFEAHFVPHRVVQANGTGFLTGYFEPELRGSRTPSPRYRVPVYRKPDDLVVLIPDEQRGTLDGEMTAGRKTADGIVPYSTRRQIDQGALRGRGLEILYLDDPVAAFFMHIQGSGRVVLDDGQVVRLSYAAKNGYPYTSIGRILLDRGEIAKADMSLDTLTAWLRAHPESADQLLWENRSYIFFQEDADAAPDAGPIGAQNVPLTDGRSLAVDPGFHALGTPIWVAAPSLDVHGQSGFHRLMVAQDVGSAIKGPERGDIYWGSGADAGAIAGRTRHTGHFYVLRPRPSRQAP